jgi:hypothetical protein
MSTRNELVGLGNTKDLDRLCSKLSPKGEGGLLYMSVRFHSSNIKALEGFIFIFIMTLELALN